MDLIGKARRHQLTPVDTDELERGTSVRGVVTRTTKTPINVEPPVDVAALLLAWYDREARVLPWRYRPGVIADPYRVWLSEIMLQQTTVKAVIPYFEAFVRRWPTVKKLAAAPIDDLLAAWAGLGYYSRARNLHKCAIAVATEHKGKFPATEAALTSLPGIGPYTAAAMASIAFGQKATVVDGNVERVVSRLFALDTPMPKAKPAIKALAQTLTPDLRAGDFAQAMMDLGATVCSPKRPSCLMCPISAQCHGHALGIAESLPIRLAKAERPVRRAIAFVVLREDGAVLVRKRADAGLLGGMLEVPSTAWNAETPSRKEALAGAPVRADWWMVSGDVVHVFTHFRLEISVMRALVPLDVSLNLWAEPQRCKFVHRRDLHAEALPSVMRKIIAHALKTE
jgi:A/G-specific adenine glycosylase